MIKLHDQRTTKNIVQAIDAKNNCIYEHNGTKYLKLNNDDRKFRHANIDNINNIIFLNLNNFEIWCIHPDVEIVLISDDVEIGFK